MPRKKENSVHRSLHGFLEEPWIVLSSFPPRTQHVQGHNSKHDIYSDMVVLAHQNKDLLSTPKSIFR
ncbi:hypothetical protein IMY05_017G0101100 [Salix suchowensis]|nr:hypothetical protein IMY05_017G0101100 [Salix suchowensis]